MWADLPRRLTTISIAVPIILAVLSKPQYAFYLIQASHLLCAVEWIRLVPQKDRQHSNIDGNVGDKNNTPNDATIGTFYHPSLVLFVILSLYTATPPQYDFLPAPTTLSASLPIFMAVLTLTSPRHISTHCINGLLFLSLGYNHLHKVYDFSLVHSIQVLFVVWNSDTGALVAGRSFQGDPVGTRLGLTETLRKISSKKSATGMVGAVVAGVLTAVSFPYLLPYLPVTIIAESHLPLLTYPMILPNCNISTFTRRALVGSILSICAVLGDLTESVTKRSAGVKDSGKLLPGHGGVLDRMDSLLLSAGVYLWLFCYDYVAIVSK